MSLTMQSDKRKLAYFGQLQRSLSLSSFEIIEMFCYSKWGQCQSDAAIIAILFSEFKESRVVAGIHHVQKPLAPNIKSPSEN